MNRYERAVKKTYYIHERYKVDATFTLLYHDLPLERETLGGMIRISDEIIEIDANHYFVVFTFTEQENAIKVCQNLLQKLDNFFQDRSTCFALDRLDTTRSAQFVLNRLHQIMAETRKHSYSRIETELILDGRM